MATNPTIVISARRFPVLFPVVVLGSLQSPLNVVCFLPRYFLELGANLSVPERLQNISRSGHWFHFYPLRHWTNGGPPYTAKSHLPSPSRNDRQVTQTTLDCALTTVHLNPRDRNSTFRFDPDHDSGESSRFSLRATTDSGWLPEVLACSIVHGNEPQELSDDNS